MSTSKNISGTPKRKKEHDLNDDFLTKFVDENSLPKLLGVRYLSATPERCEAEMPVTPLALNSVGRVHGAVLMLLADVTAAAAANCAGEIALSSCGSYEIYRSVPDGTLHSVATLRMNGKKLQYHDVEIRDDAGTLLFHAVMQSYRVDRR